MGDLIDRNAAIDALGEKPLVWDDLSDFDLGKAAQWSDDVDAIKELPSAQLKNCDDTISRQDAIMAVKMGALSAATLYGRTDEGSTALYETVRAIKAIPSAQPEIIRCRDCKHYYFADNRIPQERRYTCDLDGDRWSPDSYCSFAERKDDE